MESEFEHETCKNVNTALRNSTSVSLHEIPDKFPIDNHDPTKR